MRPKSKFNEPERLEAVSKLVRCLKASVSDGRDLILTVRGIIRSYIDSGYNIDNDVMSNVLGIDSETDDINVQSDDFASEFERVFLIYNGPLDESRRAIYDYISEREVVP
jgi:hypothetical protein